MNRREFLRETLGGFAAGAVGVVGPRPGRPLSFPSSGADAPNPGQSEGSGGSGLVRIQGRIRMEAILRAGAFAASGGEDGRYHALVHEGGGAAPKSLLTTPVSDAELARRLREMGAEDGGGVPMAAWNLRHVPVVPWPNVRVRGTRLRIRVEAEGWDAPRSLEGLLRDPGGRGVAFRFGGNEEHDDEWESGCIACLYSCPGGVVSNERYSIRDYVEGTTRFAPAPDLPEGPTPVTVTLELLG